MLQAVAYPDRIELRERDEPPLGPTDVAVRVAYAGVCGSDLHILALPQDFGADLAGGLVLGHEWSGVVDAVGPDVARVRPGMRVAARPRLPCAACPRVPACRPTACRAWRRPLSGAWADRVVLDQDFLVPLPDDVPLLDAALTEPLACALRGIELVDARAGDRVLVIGGGPLGLLAALAAGRAGASRVVVAETSSYRRELAAALGLEVEDPAAGQYDGQPFETVYEAVGRAATVQAALARVDAGGTVVVLGVAPGGETLPLAPFEVFARQLSIHGAWGVETTFSRALALLGPLGAARLATHVLALGEIEEALALARAGLAGKVVLAGDAALSEPAA